MDEQLSILLSGYLDGELDAAQRARVEAALEADPAARAELAEMRRLKELADALGADARGDAAIEVFWGRVYNRLERRTGWAMLLAGLLGLGAAGAALFFGGDAPWPVKAGVALAALGALALLLSVWRERRRLLPHDRYTREIHR